MNEKISVICPVYNVAPYIERCVKSVIGQTYTNFELLIIDDGSTDGSSKLCDEFAQQDSRIKVIHTKNKGVSSARNTGIDASDGVYIAFIDGDDYVEPYFLEDLANAINGHTMGAIGSCWEPDNGGDISCCAERLEEKIIVMDTGECFHSIYRSGIRPYVTNKIFVSEVLEKNNLYFSCKLVYGEDTFFLLQYCQYVISMGFINVNDYHYIQRKDSACHHRYNPESIHIVETFNKMKTIAMPFDETGIVDVMACVNLQKLIYDAKQYGNMYPDDIKIMKNEIRKRRTVLLKFKEMFPQRMLCLLMSYSVTLACFVLKIHFWNVWRKNRD